VGVPLVGGLTCHTKRLRYLGPGPSLIDRTLDGRQFEPIRQAAQGYHGGEGLGGVLGAWDAAEIVHVVNRS